uniref:TF-B3 domain-containing protein n=1 Tax=Leersia perrieri TaxID=77586 RepID=A0A0D9W330_9ORYZ
MADARGSSSSGGGGVGRGQAGNGDFTADHSQHNNRYHGILGAVPPPSFGRQNVMHHQYLTGMIHNPSPAMPLPVAPVPYMPQQYTMVPTPTMLPPQHHHGQSQISQGNFQDWVPSNNGAVQHVPSASQDLRPMYNGPAFMSFGQTAAASNVYYQNLNPCTIDAWTSSNMPRNQVYSGFHPDAIQDHHAPPFHSNNHDTHRGFHTHTGFRVDQALVPASSPFPLVSSSSHNFSSAKISNEPTYSKKAKKSDVKDPPIVFRRNDMKSEKNDELDQTLASEPPSINQNGALNVRFNCREYCAILRKELTNSDVGNIGRIVISKRDAEAHLPALDQREGQMLKMEDFKFEATWNFKYRFWPNNKSRMYVLESTGGFVKQHGLQTGDIFIIYKSSESGKYIVRGEKAIKPNAVRPVVDCCCKNDLNNNEECRFTVSLQTKKT